MVYYAGVGHSYAWVYASHARAVSKPLRQDVTPTLSSRSARTMNHVGGHQLVNLNGSHLMFVSIDPEKSQHLGILGLWLLSSGVSQVGLSVK